MNYEHWLGRWCLLEMTVKLSIKFSDDQKGKQSKKPSGMDKHTCLNVCAYTYIHGWIYIYIYIYTYYTSGIVTTVYPLVF